MIAQNLEVSPFGRKCTNVIIKFGKLQSATVYICGTRSIKISL